MGKKKDFSEFRPAPGDNTKMIEFSMKIMALPKIDTRDAKQVQVRS